jgi:hypothetical protein
VAAETVNVRHIVDERPAGRGASTRTSHGLAGDRFGAVPGAPSRGYLAAALDDEHEHRSRRLLRDGSSSVRRIAPTAARVGRI